MDKALLLNFFPKKIQPWLVCLSAALFYFSQVLQANMLNSANVAIAKTFSMTASDMGKISIAYFYASLFFLFLVGLLIDKVSRRKILTIACFLNVFSIIGFAMSISPWQLFVCYFVSGLAGTASLVGAMNLASRWFPKSFLASIIGIITAIGGAGAIMSQAPLLWGIQIFGWRNALLLVAFIQFIVFCFILGFVQDSPQFKKKTAQKKTTHKSFRLKKLINKNTLKKINSILKNIQNWYAGVFMACLNVSSYVLGGLWGNLYLTQSHGLPAHQASLIISVMFVGGLAGTFLMGIISDHLKKYKSLLQLEAILALVISFLLLKSNSNNVFWLSSLLFLFGFSTGGIGLTYAVVAKANSPSLISSAQSFSVTLLIFGGFSQLLFAKLMELTWDHKIHNGIPIYSFEDYQHALWLFPICMFIALMMSLLIKE